MYPTAKKEEEFEIQIEFLQPWSTFVLKTKLPPPILEKMIQITDEIVENKESDSVTFGAGQLRDQFRIDLKILEQEGLMGVFVDICRNFIVHAFCQSQPTHREKILKDEFFTELTEMWINSQKDNEYFSSHTHVDCALSTVMYLKIPEYLPSRKLYNNEDRTTKLIRVDEEDGAIEFSNNAAKDPYWGNPIMVLQPKVGDFFIFPATLQHQVYPFRTLDGKGERRSVSFNADFSRRRKQPERWFATMSEKQGTI